MNPTNYLFDGSTIPANKRNTRPMPSDPTKAADAAEYNKAMNALDDIRQYLGLVPLRLPVVSGTVTNDSATPRVVGQYTLAIPQTPLANATMTVVFGGIIASGSGKAVHCRLVNLTDNEVIGTFSTTSLTPDGQGITCPQGMGAGQVKNDGNPRLYEVRLWIDNPTVPADVATLTYAAFDFRFTSP